MVISEVIREKMGSWVDVLSPFIESEAYDNIIRFLKEESLTKKKVVCPISKEAYRSFELCNRHKMKAVVILQDPYPTVKDGIIVADGIPMSCSHTNKLQPSLENWYLQIENEYCEFNPNIDMRPDLRYLLEEEHIMLINSGLSVEKDKSGSHNILWQPFMQYFCKVLNENYRGLPIVLCGNSTIKLEKELNPLVHHIKKVEHPCVGSYQNRAWNSDGMFKWIDHIIRSNNGIYEVPHWYRLKNEGKDIAPNWVRGIDESTIGQIGEFPWDPENLLMK